MRFFGNVVGLLIFVALLFGAYKIALPYVMPCSRPLAYDIGQFDTRFGISRDDFIQTVINAEQPWETTFQRNFFTYKPGASLKVNLIYDYRQEESNQSKTLNDSIDKDLATYKQLNDSYTSLTAEYKTRLKAYNDKVSYWNTHPGISDSEYQSLETERIALNGMADRINNLATRLNALSNTTNQKVDTYNASAGKVFDKGEFTQQGVQKAINIYEFQSKPELTLALAHELGHALGMDHVQNPTSIMYPILQKQNTTTIEPTAEDKAELTRVCHL
jgi:hypothetical protein